MKDNQDPLIASNDKQAMLLKAMGSFAIFVIVILSLVMFKMYKANQVNDDLTGKARYEAKYLQRDLEKSDFERLTLTEQVEQLTENVLREKIAVVTISSAAIKNEPEYAQACADYASFMMNPAFHLMAYPGTTKEVLQNKFLANYDDNLQKDMYVWIEFLYNEKYYMMFGLSRNKGRVAEYEHLNTLNLAAQTMCINGQAKSSPKSIFTFAEGMIDPDVLNLIDVSLNKQE